MEKPGRGTDGKIDSACAGKGDVEMYVSYRRLRGVSHRLCLDLESMSLILVSRRDKCQKGAGEAETDCHLILVMFYFFNIGTNNVMNHDHEEGKNSRKTI